MLKDFYDVDSEPIVSLEMFYGPKKHLVDKCIVLFSKAILEKLLKDYECEQIATITGCNRNSQIWAFKHKGEKIAFYLSELGSALAGDLIIEANHLCGATKFIMFGSCGSLNGEFTQGKFIIPTSSYRGEGMSFYFAKASDYIEIKNAKRLASIFAELNIPFVEGKNWTTEVMLRETVNLVNKRKSEGCISVEMELSGVEAVCDFYGFDLFDFLAPGDVLAEDGYDLGSLRDANHNFDKFQIALQVAERV